MREQKNARVLVKGYVESGYQSIPYLRLSDEEYGRTLQSIVVACTDIVPIDSEQKTIYLAPRQAKPMQGWWLIGGKMIPGDSIEASAAKNLERETSLTVAPERLTLHAVFNYMWKDRSQQPSDIGCHMLGHTFSIELTPQEIEFVSQNLEKNEYKKGGLSSFDRQRLVKEKVFPAILDLYDKIFPDEN